MKLPRLHLFELHEQEFMPAIIRNYATDFISLFWIFDGFGSTEPGISLPAKLIKKALDNVETEKIVDLASGSAYPSCMMHKYLRENGYEDLQLELTDLYPNTDEFERKSKMFENVRYDTVSTNAMSNNKEGFRTMFASFHHFEPEKAQTILKDAVDQKQGIGIFEITERSWFNFFTLMVPGLLWFFLLTPFIRPFKFSRLLLTYVIPIVPLVLWWDGFVSLFRTYNEQELNEMIKQADPDNEFIWETEIATYGPARVIATVGYPKQVITETKQTDEQKLAAVEPQKVYSGSF